MCDGCIIGIWNEYESYDLVTYNELVYKVREYNEKCDLFNRVWHTTEYKNKTMQHFLDKISFFSIFHPI